MQDAQAISIAAKASNSAGRGAIGSGGSPQKHLRQTRIVLLAENKLRW
jgi:hypothetical protein